MELILAPYIAFQIALSVWAKLGVQKQQKKQLNHGAQLQLSDLTVIIPFRNEATRISPLLKSINRSQKLPKAFIFVNDSSEDNGVEIIENTLQITNYQIVSSIKSGKKNAIHQGMQLASTSYCLTFDADITFSENYFSTLKNQTVSALTILPVVIHGNSIFSKLSSLDVHFLNAINYSLTGWKRPIVASGANLLVQKEKYFIYNSLQQHEHIASGDDQFLLTNFVNNRQSVNVIIDQDLVVSTPAPSSFKDLINQRLRWIKKSIFINDRLANTVGFLQLLNQLIFISLFLLTIFKGYVLYSIVLFCMKIISDYFQSTHYFKRINIQKTVWLLPIYEFYFPIYAFLFFFLGLFITPSWKNRKIKSR